MTERTYWIALAMCQGIGNRTFQNLMAKFGSPQAVFNASIEELVKVPRITLNLAQQILSLPIEKIEEEIYSLESEEIEITTQVDETYPTNLRKAFDAPPILFVRGEINSQDEHAVAIVGAREASSQGQDIARDLAAGFAEKGWTVVSGLARGIDTTAHQGALESGGRSIGVLGSGLRIIHPKENIPTVKKMIQQGAVVSELHPNTPPNGRHLMARDRIVSGLSKALIVVEAGEKSGSVDTAHKAKKQNRPVFAVDAGSPGTTQLIQSGAYCLAPKALNIDEIIQIIHSFLNNEVDKKTEQIEIFSNARTYKI
ncbi:MAG: DNA-processing protein DprA [bacterium]